MSMERLHPMLGERMVKMKRVDAEEGEIGNTVVEEHKIATNPVVGSGGVTYVMDPQELREMMAENDLTANITPKSASPKNKQQTGSTVKKNKVVTVKSKNDHPPMEEVSYDSFVKIRDNSQFSVSDYKEDATKTVKDLIGKTFDYALAIVEDLKSRKVLSNYRFVPIGTVSSFEVQPGRVQLLLDAQKNVVDVTIS